MYHRKLYKIGHYFAWAVLGIFTVLGVVGVAGVGTAIGWPVMAVVASVVGCAAMAIAIITLNKTPLTRGIGHFTQMIDSGLNRLFKGKQFYLQQAQPIIQEAHTLNDDNDTQITTKQDKLEKLKTKFKNLQDDPWLSPARKQEIAQLMIKRLDLVATDLKVNSYDTAALAHIINQFNAGVAELEGIINDIAKISVLGLEHIKPGSNKMAISADIYISGLNKSEHIELNQLKLQFTEEQRNRIEELESYNLTKQINNFKNYLSKLDVNQLERLPRVRQQYIIDSIASKLYLLHDQVLPWQPYLETTHLVSYFKPTDEFRKFAHSQKIRQFKHNLISLKANNATHRNVIEENFQKAADNLIRAKEIFNDNNNGKKNYPYYKGLTDPFYSHYTQRHEQLENQIMQEKMLIKRLRKESLKTVVDGIFKLKQTIQEYIQSLSQIITVAKEPPTDERISGCEHGKSTKSEKIRKTQGNYSPSMFNDMSKQNSSQKSFKSRGLKKQQASANSDEASARIEKSIRDSKANSMDFSSNIIAQMVA